MASLPSVKLEMLINDTWVDLAGTPARLDGTTPQSRLLWSDSGGPVQIVRGVADDGSVASGTLDCVLENNDGALTPGKTTSPYYPYLTKGRKVRFSSLTGGSWRYRFAGYIWAEPLTWGNEVGTSCTVRMSAIDTIGMAYTPLRSVAVEVTAARSPIAYWPLTDSETTSAADQSGNSRPGLVVQQWGTGGEIGWASGAVLPTDNVGGVVFTPATDNGVYLASDVGIDLPTTWVATFVATPAAKDGYLFQIGTDSYSIGVWYDTSANTMSAIETKLNSSGDPIDYVLSASGAWGTASRLDYLTVTPTTVKLGSSGTTGTRNSSARMLDSIVAVGGASAVESGRARMYSGEMKHLALWPSVAAISGITAEVMTGPADMLTLSTAVAQVMTWAGVSSSGGWNAMPNARPTVGGATSHMLPRWSWALSIDGGWGTPVEGLSGIVLLTCPGAQGAASQGLDFYGDPGAPASSGGAPIVGGTTYTFSCWVFSLSSGTHQMGVSIRFVNPSGYTSVQFSGTPQSAASGVWRWVSVTADAPAGSTWAYLSVRDFSAVGWVAGNQIGAAAFLLEQSSDLHKFYDSVPLMFGSDRAVQLLKTEGMSAADLLSQYARGSMSRIYCSDNSVIVASWDYSPAAITAPAGDIDPEIEWGADSEAEANGARMTFPDGSVYQVGDGALDMPGVLSAADGRSIAEWVVATSGGSPRFPDASYNLLSMSNAEAAALAVADVASTIVVPGLPTQLPNSSQSGVVDAVVETYADDVWDFAFTTSSDSRDEMLIVGNASSGRVTAGYLAAPFGPVVDETNGSWRAGDEVTHTHLNASAWTGPEVDSGNVTITTVANTVTSLSVAFPFTFSSTPNVIVTPLAGSTGLTIEGVSVGSVSTTGFFVYIYRTTATVTVIQWLAAN